MQSFFNSEYQPRIPLSDQEISWILLDYIATMRSVSLQAVCSHELYVLLLKKNAEEPVDNSEWKQYVWEFAQLCDFYEQYWLSFEGFKEKIIQTLQSDSKSMVQQWIVRLRTLRFARYEHKYGLYFENKDDLLARIRYAFPQHDDDIIAKVNTLADAAQVYFVECSINHIKDDMFWFTLSLLFDWLHSSTRLHLNEKVESLPLLFEQCRSIQVSPVKWDTWLLPIQKPQYFGFDLFTQLIKTPSLLDQVSYFDSELSVLLHEYRYGDYDAEHKQTIYTTIKNNHHRVTYLRYLLQHGWVEKQPQEKSNDYETSWSLSQKLGDYLDIWLETNVHSSVIVFEIALKPWAKDALWNTFNVPYFSSRAEFKNRLSYLFWWTIPKMIQTDLVQFDTVKRDNSIKLSLELHVLPDGTSIIDGMAYEFVFTLLYDDWKEEDSLDLFYTCIDLEECSTILEKCNIDNDPISSLLLPFENDLNLFSLIRLRDLVDVSKIKAFSNELYVRMETLRELFDQTNNDDANELIQNIINEITNNPAWNDFLLDELYDDSLERLQKIIALSESTDFSIQVVDAFWLPTSEVMLYKKNKDDMRQLKQLYRWLNTMFWYRLSIKDFSWWKEIYFSISWHIAKHGMIELYIEFSGTDESQLISYSPIISLEQMHTLLKTFCDTSSGIDNTIRWEIEDFGKYWYDRNDDDLEDEDS